MTTSVTKLKELLFDAEAQRLDDVQKRLQALAEAEDQRHDTVMARQTEFARRLDSVFDRAGTEDRLLKSVAAILDGALREAEVTRHEPLSQAVAPLVVKTIKHELRNSQDEMVDALYPLTGKLVKEYVRAAMADMMADINRRLGGSTPSELETRAKALGISVAELVVAESQELKIDELFLVRKGSGDLVAHWERPDGDSPSVRPPSAGPGAGSNRDVLIAGYLSGITQFSEEAFDERKGSVRSIDMNGEKIFVRSSPAYLLAARCSGRAPAAVEQVIDDAFLHLLGTYRQVLTDGKANDPEASAVIQKLLPSVAADCESRFAVARSDLANRAAAVKPPGKGRLYALAAAVLLPLLAWIGWSLWQASETARVRTATQSVVASMTELQGYPVLVEVERGGRALALSGLMPTTAVRDRLMTALATAVPGTDIRGRVGVLPSVPGLPPVPPDLSTDVATLRQALAATREQSSALDARLGTLSRSVEAELPALRNQVSPLPQQTASALAETQRMQASLAALAARIDAIRIPAVSPRDRLDTYLRDNAVFFANGTEFLDEARSSAVLDELAALIRDTDALVRVVGHTDERGAPGVNSTLGQSRAERVAAALAERGVPRDRLIVVGRATMFELSRATGPGSANRRVTFELGYRGEPGGR